MLQDFDSLGRYVTLLPGFQRPEHKHNPFIWAQLALLHLYWHASSLTERIPQNTNWIHISWIIGFIVLFISLPSIHEEVFITKYNKIYCWKLLLLFYTCMYYTHICTFNTYNRLLGIWMTYNYCSLK